MRWYRSAECSGCCQAINSHAFGHEIETRKVEPLVLEGSLSIITLVGDNENSNIREDRH